MLVSGKLSIFMANWYFQVIFFRPPAKCLSERLCSYPK